MYNVFICVRDGSCYRNFSFEVKSLIDISFEFDNDVSILRVGNQSFVFGVDFEIVTINIFHIGV